MKVHSVECQLAQAQMNLYLAGDTMAEETVAELEKHIAGCEACRQALRAKKQSLQSMLKAVGAPNPVAPTVRQELRIEVPAEEEVPLDAVPAALRPKGTPDSYGHPVHESSPRCLCPISLSVRYQRSQLSSFHRDSSQLPQEVQLIPSIW